MCSTTDLYESRLYLTAPNEVGEQVEQPTDNGHRLAGDDSASYLQWVAHSSIQITMETDQQCVLLDITVKLKYMYMYCMGMYMYMQNVQWTTYLQCILLTRVEPRVGCMDETQQEHPTKGKQKSNINN